MRSIWVLPTEILFYTSSVHGLTLKEPWESQNGYTLIINLFLVDFERLLATGHRVTVNFCSNASNEACVWQQYGQAVYFYSTHWLYYNHDGVWVGAFKRTQMFPWGISRKGERLENVQGAIFLFEVQREPSGWRREGGLQNFSFRWLMVGPFRSLHAIISLPKYFHGFSLSKYSQWWST